MGSTSTKGNQHQSFTVETYQNEDAHFLDWNSEARVDYITVEGLRRTKNDVIENAVRDLFSAKTFSGMLGKISYVTERLNNLDSFLDIKVYIDVNRSKNASENGYKVIYKLEEKGYARVQSNFALGDNEGVVVVKGKLLNLKGRGEKIETTYSYSTGKTADTNISFVKPLLTRLPTVASASVFHHATEEIESGYRLKESGVLLNLEVRPLPKTGQFSLNVGLMKQIDGNKTISMCDKLFLGGPLSVRGFGSRGIGSHSDGCSLGMSSYWASGFHLYSRVPFVSENSIISKLCRTHLFMNVGACGPFELSRNVSHNMDELTKNLRAAYGLGFCFHIGPSRIELNCCLPFLYSRNDSIIRGFQISVGTIFL